MKRIIFIHGMFQNAKSWKKWVSFFSEKGFDCIAESWPFHDGEPWKLRSRPPRGLGDLRLDEVVTHYDNLARQFPDAILVGHSVGGLVVQKLINAGLGSLGICISSVAPNRMLSLDWGFFRNNIMVANPFKGDKPFLMTPELFHKYFANNMDQNGSDHAYDSTATHDSRNVLRDCMLGAGDIDLEKTRQRLLFIGAGKDRIIPPELSKKNAEAYGNLADFIEFPDRGHFICGDPRWEEVAVFVHKWLEKQSAATSQS